MNARDFSEDEILKHLEDGEQIVCSIRLASGGDFTITITSVDDYEVVKDDIIPEYEMVIFRPNSK